MIFDASELSIAAFENIPVFATRLDLFRECMAIVPPKGQLLEFGVCMGYSINSMSKMVAPRLFHGFDSFEGLPEDWVMEVGAPMTHPKGCMAVSALPVVEPNVTLYKGWFNETLPGWLGSYPGDIAFVHLDADLYSSTIYVLKELNSRLVPGSIILFDELSDWVTGTGTRYPNWEEHEWKALKEWMIQYNRKISLLFRSNCYQAAIRIEC